MPRTDSERGAGPRSLLERDEELAVLLDATANAAEGHGGMVLVQAAAGLGKTRLLGAAEAAAHGAGMQVLHARGSVLERDFPFGVVLRLFESRLRAASVLERESIMAGSAALAGPMLLGAQPVEQALNGLQEHSLVHALQWVAVNLSAQAPLALIADDLHWADAASLRFLAYLAARIEDLSVLVVGAMRPREPGAEHDLLAQIAAAANVRVLAPKALSDEAAALLVRSTQGTGGAADAFIRACYEETGGNPLLLEELLRVLAADGVEGRDDDVPSVRVAGPAPVTRSVRSTLARLGPDETAIARGIAVLGDDVDPTAAARLSGLAPAAAAAAAAALQDASLLASTKNLQFTHPMLRRVVYEDIPSAARADLHRRAAEVVGDDARAAAAHLLLCPGARDPWAVERLRTAAQGAAERGAHATAARLLRRAVAEPPAEAQRRGILAAAGEAASRAGEPDAVALLEAAIDATAHPADRARLLLVQGRSHYQHGEMVAATEACARALTEPGLDDDLREELDAARIAAALWTPAGGDAVAGLTATGPAPRTLGRRDLFAGVAANELIKGEDRERAIALARAAWGDGAYLEQGTADSPALGAMVSALLRGGALDDALAVLDALIADARRRASPLAYATWRTARGTCLHHLGRLVEAESDIEEALDARRIGWEATLPFAISTLVAVLLEQDRMRAAEALLEDLGDAEQNFGAGPLWGLVHTARGKLAMATNDPEAALEHFLETGKRATEGLGTRNPAISSWRSDAALAMRAVGRPDDAIDLAAEGVADARRFRAARPLAIALCAQAVVTGEPEHAEEALTVATEGGVPLLAIEAQVVRGSLLRAAGRRIDAREILRPALDRAVKTGAHALARRARDELQMAGGRPRRLRTSGPDSLTAGERRVALLAADGFTNREIADALFVTPKAVGFHLGNAYRKLGISGRTALVSALTLAEPVTSD